MKYVEVVADAGSLDTILAISEKYEVRDLRLGLVGEDGMQQMRLLVSDDKTQPVLDSLQGVLGAQPSARILVLPIEIALLPKQSKEERKEEDSAIAVRESLYNNVEKNSHLDMNFVVLVILSTIVVAIGLIANNIAVVIGAMVIAPLLGPNLAFGFGTALGDIYLMRKSALTTIVGIALAIALSTVIGFFWPFEILSSELISRTDVGLDSVALALASGAAAALSLTSGLSSILVGVMVAVALLPPAAALGIMLGHGEANFAIGAGLLLAINVVCINLASNIVFFIKGIGPRTWWEKEKAKRAMSIYVLVWLISVIILLLLVFTRQKLVVI
jgi:uncharacterized hydrophobic protein (TIGR00341 family)